jgi:hypothetical protein
MDNPTPENLSRFYTAQRLMLDIGTRFSDKSKDYFLKNPMMSEKRRQPVEKLPWMHIVRLWKKPADGNERYFHKIQLFLFPSTTARAVQKVKSSSWCRITIRSTFSLSAWMADCTKRLFQILCP